MKESVDKKLSSKIKQVFDDYEEPSADAGWEKLQQKYSDKKRRPIILWMSSAAAIFLFFLGFWLIGHDEQTEVSKGNKDQNKEIANKESLPPDSERSTADQSVPKGTLNENASGNNNVAKSGRTTRSEKTPQPTRFPDQPDTLMQELSEAQEFTAIKLPEEVKKSISAELNFSDRDSISSMTVEPTTKMKNGNALMANPINDPIKKKTENDSKGRRMAFSLFAGSFFNYSEGSENQLNFSAGFTSDIRLSKNLKFSTGLSLASNSLSFESEQLPQNAVSLFNSAKDQSAVGTSTVITGYDADLLALDFPLNLKYQFVPESDKFYVLAGLSSGAFLRETYDYQYLNFNSTSGIPSAQAQDQKIKKQLSDFDLARTLNVSFGLSTGFGKTQTISIEPFLKYPLGGLGSENLKFGSSGINLKLHFLPVKK